MQGGSLCGQSSRISFSHAFRASNRERERESAHDVENDDYEVASLQETHPESCVHARRCICLSVPDEWRREARGSSPSLLLPASGLRYLSGCASAQRLFLGCPALFGAHAKLRGGCLYLDYRFTLKRVKPKTSTAWEAEAESGLHRL